MSFMFSIAWILLSVSIRAVAFVILMLTSVMELLSLERVDPKYLKLLTCCIKQGWKSGTMYISFIWSYLCLRREHFFSIKFSLYVTCILQLLIFSYQATLDAHKKMHATNIPYNCHVCGQQCNTGAELVLHKQDQGCAKVYLPRSEEDDADPEKVNISCARSVAIKHIRITGDL